MSRKAWLLLIFAAACIAFAPALINEYVFDDVPLVQEHAAPHGMAGIAQLIQEIGQPWWPADHHKNLWRPLTRLTISIQQWLQPQSLRWPFYALNIVLHACVAMLVFAFGRRTGLSLRAAGVAGLLFAVHPTHSEAVAQIVGRAELLAALAMLAGLCRLWDAAPTKLNRPAVWLEQAAWMALALAAKEHALAYPAFGALVIIAQRDRSTPDTRTPDTRATEARTMDARNILAQATESRSSNIKLLRRGALLSAMLCGIGVLFLIAKYRVTGGLLESPTSIPFHENELAQLSFFERLPHVMTIALQALSNSIAGNRLYSDYSYASFPWSRTPSQGVTRDLLLFGAMVFFLSAALLGWIAWRASRGDRGVSLLLATLIAYAMISNGPFVIGVVTAERLWYWPSVGLALATGWAATRWEKLGVFDNRKFASVLLGGICAFFILNTWAYATAWRTPRQRADYILAKNLNNWRALVDRSRDAFNTRDFELGLTDAEVATLTLPTYSIGWDWLGQNAMFTGKAEMAETAFQRALELDAHADKVHYHLANLYESQGRKADAARELRAYLAGTETDNRARAQQRLAVLQAK